MAKRGFFFDLTDQMENNANVHREVVARIEELTKRNLVCYLANPGHPGGAMQDHDPDLLENVLRSMDLALYERRLDLLINSPGGFPYAAQKMVKVCRAFSSEFRTIVVSRAMSAATLLCLGSDELLMAETASLGPIDPQMVTGSPPQQRLVPASVIIESFRQMLGAAQQAIAAKQPPDPFFHVLDTLDVTGVFESMKAIDSTKIIAKDLLREGLLRKSLATVEKVVNELVAEGAKELHSKHLYPAILNASIGLPVTELRSGDDLDMLLHELFVRMERYAAQKALAKYVLTRQGGIDVNVQVQAVRRAP
ncbi:MAG: hypothetical protein FJ290_16150 [Planctomycetes bacterium]|nr:hypothetical protein [Planctomycetota bacterium]